MSTQERGAFTLRLARPDEAARIAAFLDEHWGEKHPLVHIPELFGFYYRPFGPDGPLQFAVAEQDGKLAAVAGYIRANRLDTPDIWVSILSAAKSATGSGLELLAAMRGLTHARQVACNNIRPRVMPLYRFAGFTTGRLAHYYRLADREAYQIARIANKTILPASGRAVLRLLPTENDLLSCGYTPDEAHRPYKDLWYLARRYYHYPFQKYDVWGVLESGAGAAQTTDTAETMGAAQTTGTANTAGMAQTMETAVTALLVTRCIPANGTCVLRVVDYTGAPEAFSALGTAIDRLMAECGAEYADCYCAGIPEDAMAAAGFCARCEGDANILPNYLTPPLYENTDYYYFAWDPEDFTMFKADGDQDRPNLPVE